MVKERSVCAQLARLLLFATGFLFCLAIFSGVEVRSLLWGIQPVAASQLDTQVSDAPITGSQTEMAIPLEPALIPAQHVPQFPDTPLLVEDPPRVAVRAEPARVVARENALSVFTAAQAKAAPVAKTLRLYIYDLSGVPGAVRIDAKDNTNNQNDWHEKTIIGLLSKSAHRVHDPADADFFFVPAPLVRHYGLHRSQSSCCYGLDEAIVNAMRRVGSYWDKQQGRHIVSNLKCPFKDHAHPWYKRFPKLWGSKQALFICLEANANGMDARRSLHSAYYVRPDFFDDGLEAQSSGSSSRDVLAMYAGAAANKNANWKPMVIRRRIWDGLNNCKECTVLASGHMGSRVPKADFYPRLRALLHRARFQIVPPGDTIERSSRDQCIGMGVVPVYWGWFKGIYHALPWSDIINWDAFSVNFTSYQSALHHDFWPGLEARLREMVRSGEADRLTAGVAKVQARFRWTEDGVVH